MLYSLYTTPAASRVWKKLPSEVRKHLYTELEILKTEPLAGEQLKGKFRHLRCLHTRYKNSDYRVVYRVIEQAQQILVYFAATRENFYKQLERMPLKS